MGVILNEKERRDRATFALDALMDFLDAEPVLSVPSEGVLNEAASVLRLYITDGA